MANVKRYEELNKQNLEKMYVQNNMLAAEIAAEIGCSVSAVHAAARHFGLKKRNSGALSKQQEKTQSVPESVMRDLYINQGLTLEEAHNQLTKMNLSHSRDINDLDHNPFKYLDAKPSPAIISELYSECHNVNELANRLGVCYKTALNWLREADIELVQQKRITQAQLEKAIKENDSLAAISEKLGYSEDLVIQYAKKYGYNVYARKAD